MRPFNTCDGRKTSTFRGKIGTSSPVFGLRPIRCPFRRTEKLPKEEILTTSSRAKALDIWPRGFQQFGRFIPLKDRLLDIRLRSTERE